MEGKIERKENYFLGIIGAILGGLIIAIPLVFGYIYSGWIFILAIAVLIATFEFYGYKWFRGKINDKLPIILLIVTAVIVLIITVILIPLALLIKSNLPISIETMKNLYDSNKVLLSIMQDGLFSLVFSLLGVYSVASIIKKKLLLNVANIDLFSSDNKEKQEFKLKAIDELKPSFEKYNAMEKEKTITKEELLADFKNNDSKKYFDYLKQMKIIKKYKGKYYYSVEDESNIKVYYSIAKISRAICLTTIAVVVILVSFGNTISKTTQKVYNNDVSFSIDTSWNMFGEYTEENGWIYYKYLGAEENQEGSDHAYPSTIGVTYEKNVVEGYKSIDDVRAVLELYLNEYLNYDGYNISLFTTSKGYDAIKLIIKDEKTMEFDYYIFKDGKVAYITAISFITEEKVLDELDEYTKDVVNSFSWSK